MVLLACGGVIFWLVGVRMWMFAAVVAAGAAAVPVAWQFLHSYQKNRILTFLNPENDPLGAGYHILQSKIALGSGVCSARAFSPARRATSISCRKSRPTSSSPCWPRSSASIGSLAVILGLYGPAASLYWRFAIAFRRSRNQFRPGCFPSASTTNLFLYVFINMAMVMGVLPGGRRAAAAGLLWRHRPVDRNDRP